MSNEKVIKGTEEKAAQDKLEAFMEKHEQKPTFIADEIRAKENTKFSPQTIYRWLADKQTMTFKNWDFIVNHMKRYK